MKVQIIKFDNFFKAPERAYYNDAGLDIYSPYTISIPPKQIGVFPLSFGLILPDNLCGLVISRTSQVKNGLEVITTLVDAGYRGEIHIAIKNNTDKQYFYNRGDRIGQLLITPYYNIELVETLGATRDENNFGSTGK